jgi:hypothetical protein
LQRSYWKVIFDADNQELDHDRERVAELASLALLCFDSGDNAGCVHFSVEAWWFDGLRVPRSHDLLSLRVAMPSVSGRATGFLETLYECLGPFLGDNDLLGGDFVHSQLFIP